MLHTFKHGDDESLEVTKKIVIFRHILTLYVTLGDRILSTSGTWHMSRNQRLIILMEKL